MLSQNLGALGDLQRSLPELITVLTVVTALCLIAAAYVVYRELLFGSKKSIAASILLTTASLVVPLAIRTYEHAWIVGALITSGFLILIPSYLRPRQTRSSRIPVVIILITTAAALSTSLIASQRQTTFASSDMQLSRAQTRITAMAESSVRNSSELAELETTRDLLKAESGRRPELITALASELRQRGLDFAIIANTSGAVISRVHQPSSPTGDSLFQDAPWALESVADGRTIGGRAILENNLPSTAGAAPIRIRDITEGVIVAGIRIDEKSLSALSDNGGIAVSTNQGVRAIATSTDSTRTVYQSAVVDEALRANTVPSSIGKTFSFSITNDDSRFTGSQIVLSTLRGDDALGLFALTDESGGPIHPLFAALAGALAGVLISLALNPLASLRMIVESIRRAVPKRRSDA